MESRCYGCAIKFTLFKKEYGCKNCGRAFCSGCLNFSAMVPRAGNTQQKVCKQCHEVLTRGSSPANASKWSPPQNYKKRMASLEAQQKPRTLRSQGLNQQDQLIAERLARLRQEDKPKPVASEAEIAARLAALRSGTQTAVPSTQEMEARLAVLQGRTLPPQALQPAQHSVDTRTQAQQTQDLLAQLTTEVALDESREQKGSVTLQDYHFPDSDDEEDEETAIQRILQQLTEEAALDEMSGFNIPVEPALQPQTRTCREEPKAPHPRPKAEDDELPWCCICNEDATLRCTGCNRDLYCARCFREGHDVFDLEEHQTSAYHPPRAGQDY
ncbi:abscission/NoCut checkpoint regulator isoform X3 [Erinaceus europaeus]|uniref:Abscission/NoCut checkpoint regulator n=1 Tax=Erinaceus europaeus TaxID=9365 RepID=A0A1S3AN04_ERIEU|nr:abscission/NoCut checkpoint regulator isoform X3 [Erinaceus europaeus]